MSHAEGVGLNGWSDFVDRSVQQETNCFYVFSVLVLYQLDDPDSFGTDAANSTSILTDIATDFDNMFLPDFIDKYRFWPI